MTEQDQCKHIHCCCNLQLDFDTNFEDFINNPPNLPKAV